MLQLLLFLIFLACFRPICSLFWVIWGDVVFISLHVNVIIILNAIVTRCKLDISHCLLRVFTKIYEFTNIHAYRAITPKLKFFRSWQLSKNLCIFWGCWCQILRDFIFDKKILTIKRVILPLFSCNFIVNAVTVILRNSQGSPSVSFSRTGVPYRRQAAHC